jgi:hypothetical protein
MADPLNLGLAGLKGVVDHVDPAAHSGTNLPLGQTLSFHAVLGAQLAGIEALGASADLASSAGGEASSDNGARPNAGGGGELAKLMIAQAAFDTNARSAKSGDLSVKAIQKLSES